LLFEGAFGQIAVPAVNPVPVAAPGQPPPAQLAPTTPAAPALAQSSPGPTNPTVAPINPTVAQTNPTVAPINPAVPQTNPIVPQTNPIVIGQSNTNVAQTKPANALMPTPVGNSGQVPSKAVDANGGSSLDSAMSGSAPSDSSAAVAQPPPQGALGGISITSGSEEELTTIGSQLVIVDETTQTPSSNPSLVTSDPCIDPLSSIHSTGKVPQPNVQISLRATQVDPTSSKFRVEVTSVAPQPVSFVAFSLQARATGGLTPLGQWELDDVSSSDGDVVAVMKDCNGGSVLVTAKSAVPKTEAAAIWTPPNTFSGQAELWATLVGPQPDVFWIGIKSNPLRIGSTLPDAASNESVVVPAGKSGVQATQQLTNTSSTANATSPETAKQPVDDNSAAQDVQVSSWQCLISCLTCVLVAQKLLPFHL